jgi:uroporphyrinogen-III decarboxylase
MKNRERFLNTLNFKPVDRLPVVEWAGWWDKTINRWKNEGLPKKLKEDGEIRDFFELDVIRQCWIEPRKPGYPENNNNYKALVSNIDEYIKLKELLFPLVTFDEKLIESWAEEQKKNDMVIWITLEGFYWFPRTIFGMEEHIYAFYDQPELMHMMNKDQLDFNIQSLDKFCKICKPDFMTFAEDMSYNHGPMISKQLFDEFLAPYYKQIIPRVKDYDIIPFVDTDGNPAELISWFMDLGIDAFLPMERQAGTDINELRKNHSSLRMIGGYDKTVMNKTENDIRDEFERILPVMKAGGYVVGVDHQTPPEVSMDNYRIYLNLLREYCTKAAG